MNGQELSRGDLARLEAVRTRVRALASERPDFARRLRDSQPAFETLMERYGAECRAYDERLLALARDQLRTGRVCSRIRTGRDPFLEIAVRIPCTDHLAERLDREVLEGDLEREVAALALTAIDAPAPNGRIVTVTVPKPADWSPPLNPYSVDRKDLEALPARDYETVVYARLAGLADTGSCRPFWSPPRSTGNLAVDVGRLAAHRYITPAVGETRNAQQPDLSPHDLPPAIAEQMLQHATGWLKNADTNPVVAEALAEYDADRERDEARLLADPAFQANAALGRRWSVAQRAVAEAAAPYRAALDTLMAEQPQGGSVGSDAARKFAALTARIRKVELDTYAAHGFPQLKPPASPAELLARLRRVELSEWFDLQEAISLSRPSELLWRDADGLRKRDPFLPELPAKPTAGRERCAALIRWCEDCIVQGLGALLRAFDRFYTTLDATTVPGEGGRRTVGGIAHAVALSEATNALHRELGATFLRLSQQHGQSVAEFPPGVALMESDSPDGPCTPIPAGEVRITSMGIGGNGADAILLAALDSATKVTAFPIDKWNAMQATRPGANHQRFHAGDVVSAPDLAALESAAKLLRMKAPAPTPTVSVSPDLLDRLQRAAAAADPHAIDRAAELAAEKMARVFGAGDNGDGRPPARTAGGVESAGPALTANQSRVLQTMALFDASRLVSADAIAAEMDPAGRLSARTIGPIVRRLIELRLAERPEGDRSGARLTAAGRRLALKIAD